MDVVKDFLGGFSGGALSTLLLHPFDLVRNRQAVADDTLNDRRTKTNSLFCDQFLKMMVRVPFGEELHQDLSERACRGVFTFLCII